MNCRFVAHRCIRCGAWATSANVARTCDGGSPGFLTTIKNFATSAAAHVAAGMPMASDEEIIRRHDICLTCEHLQDGACTHCGCPISRVAGYVSKLSWAGEECPIGKWGKAPANA